MIELKVINGIKKDRPDYFSLYSTVFINTLRSALKKYRVLEEYDLDTLRKLVWSGTKMMNASRSRSNDRQRATNKLEIIQDISIIASRLTPREFQTVFPIQKDYKGKKFGRKDYFDTKKYIEGIGEDKVIGENISMFLRNYYNWDVINFRIEEKYIESDLRQIEINQDAQFQPSNDIDEVQKVKKTKIRHLRVIK